MKLNIKIKITLVLLSILMIPAVFISGRDHFIKIIASSALTKLTGTRAEVGSLKLNLIKGNLKLKNINIHQPEGFGDGTMMSASELNINFDPGSLFEKEIQVELLNISIRDFVAVTDKNGKINADQLKFNHLAIRKSDKGAETGDSGDISESEGIPVHIKKMNLSLERVVHKELRDDGLIVQAYEVNIKDTPYDHVDSPSELAKIILVQGLKSAAIKNALIYGTAAATGVGIIPAAAVMIATEKSGIEREYKISIRKAFKYSLKALGIIGTVKEAEITKGIITASANGCDLKVEFDKKGFNRTGIKVSARKLLLPQLATASGVLYMIEEIGGIRGDSTMKQESLKNG